MYKDISQIEVWECHRCGVAFNTNSRKCEELGCGVARSCWDDIVPCFRTAICKYEHCNKEFETNKGSQIYCEELCRLRNNYYTNTGDIPSGTTTVQAFKRWVVKRSACKSIGREFTLTDKDVQRLFDMESCQYCGKQGKCIERMDNNKGYTNDNVTWSCVRCNTLKGDRTFEEFAKIMEKPEKEQRFHFQIRKYANVS